MRLFLGIDLPEETKQDLFNSIESLRKKHPSFKWVEPKNYHLTLHFFGEVHNPEEVAKRLQDILYDAKSFHLYTLELDTFVRKQIVLYLNFKRQKKMEQIVNTVKVDLGVDDKTAFTPHITLSRSSLSSKQQYFALKNEIEKLKISLEFEVNTLYLFESVLTGKQPVYKKFTEFNLLTEK